MKVFSLKKFLESEGINDNTIEAVLSGWPKKAEGLTREACEKIDIEVSDNWMIEVSNKVFSITAFALALNDDKEFLESIECGWPQKMQGFSQEQARELGYFINDTWLVERGNG